MSQLKLGLIYGSSRHGRFCDRIAVWIPHRVLRDGRSPIDAVDPQLAKGSELVSRIDKGDSFIVMTSEYNHSFPAPLRELVDSAKKEWEAEPVAFVSYGGINGRLRAVERLRGVFAELHAVGIRDGVSFTNACEQFGERGQPLHPERAEPARCALLRRLHWWALALRGEQAKRSFGEAA